MGIVNRGILLGGSSDSGGGVVAWADVADKPSLFDSDWNSTVLNKPVVFPSDWASVSGKPTVFPSDWGNVGGKPTVFPSDWDSVGGKPAVFPPDTTNLAAVAVSGDANDLVNLPSGGDEPNIVLRNYTLDEWITATTAFDDQPFVALHWAPTVKTFTAVAENGGISYSTNGVDWTKTSAGNIWRTDITYSPSLNLWVTTSRSNPRISYSSDLVTWWSGTHPAQSFTGIVWAESLGIFVAIAHDGTDRIATSPDGITWTLRSCPAENWQSITWSPDLGLLAAVNTSNVGNRVMTSPDGITWTLQATPADNSWENIEWLSGFGGATGMFVALATYSGSDKIMTSPDGVNWTLRSAGTASLYGVQYAKELGVAVAVGPNAVVTSADGVTWTPHVVNAGTDARALKWSRELGIFIALGYSGTGRIKTTNSAWGYPYTPSPSSGMSALSEDTAPTLGGMLTTNGYNIYSGGTNNLTITADGTLALDGATGVSLGGLAYPIADGAAGTVLRTDGLGTLTFGSVAWDEVTAKPVFSTVATSGSYTDLLNQPLTISQVADDTAPTLGGNLDAGAYSIRNATIDTYDVAHTTPAIATGALTLTTSNVQHVTLTENVTAITLPAVTAMTQILVVLAQDATGGRTVTGWPASVRWPGGTAPTVTATANAVDAIVLTYNSVLGIWLGNYDQGYA